MLAGLAGVAMGTTLVAGLVWYVTRPAPPVTGLAPPADDVEPKTAFTPKEPLGPAALRAPAIIAPLDGRPLPSYVTLLEDSERRRRLAMFDAKDGHVRWMTEPLDKGATFVVVPNRIAVATSHQVQLYDLREGRFLTSFSADPAAEICLARTAGLRRGPKAADGSFYVGNLEADPNEILVIGPKGTTTILNTETGAHRDPPNEVWCFSNEVVAQGQGCPRTDSDDCARYTDPPFKTPGFQSFQTFFEGTQRVSIGGSGTIDAIGFAKGAHAPAWSSKLTSRAHAEAKGYVHSGIGEGRFYSAYQEDERHGWVVARDLLTGEELWSTELYPDGDPYPVAMSTTQGILIVQTRMRTLNVLDAKTGALLHYRGDARP